MLQKTLQTLLRVGQNVLEHHLILLTSSHCITVSVLLLNHLLYVIKRDLIHSKLCIS